MYKCCFSFFKPTAPTAWFSHKAKRGHESSFHQAAKHKEPVGQTGGIVWLSKPWSGWYFLFWPLWCKKYILYVGNGWGLRTSRMRLNWMSTPKPKTWNDPVLLWKVRFLMMFRIYSFWFFDLLFNPSLRNSLDLFLPIPASRRRLMSVVWTSKPQLVSWTRRWALVSVSRKHDTYHIYILEIPGTFLHPNVDGCTILICHS